MWHDELTSFSLWLEPLIAVTVSAALTAVVAAFAARLVVRPTWQRTIWRSASVGMLLLVVVELTGIGAGLARLLAINLHWAVDGRGGTVSVGHTDVAELDAERIREPAGRCTPNDAAVLEPERFGLDEGSQSTAVRPDWPIGRTDVSGGANEVIHLTDGLSYARTHRGGGASDEDRREAPTLVDSADPASLGTPLSARLIDSSSNTTDSPPGISATSVVWWQWWPGATWVFGSILVFARFAWQRLLLQRFRQRETRVQEACLLERVSQLADRLRLRAQPVVLTTNRIRAPVAFGIWPPTVVLPDSFDDDFDESQQNVILAHELAHLAAGDPAWKLLADLLCVALWWHPASWYVRSQMHRACESAADESSLLFPQGPTLLADCLVTLGRRLDRSRQLAWSSVRGSEYRSGLGKRVRRLLMLDGHKWKAPARWRHTIVAGVLVPFILSTTIVSTSWTRPVKPQPTKGTEMSVLTSSWRTSVASTLALALVGYVAQQTSADEPEKHAIEVPQEQPNDDRIESGYSDELAAEVEPDKSDEPPNGSDRHAEAADDELRQERAAMEDYFHTQPRGEEAPASQAMERAVRYLLGQTRRDQMRELAQLALEKEKEAVRTAQVLRQIELIRQAAANLREAGLDEQAEQVLRQAEDLKQFGSDRERIKRDRPRDDFRDAQLDVRRDEPARPHPDYPRVPDEFGDYYEGCDIYGGRPEHSDSEFRDETRSEDALDQDEGSTGQRFRRLRVAYTAEIADLREEVRGMRREMEKLHELLERLQRRDPEREGY